MINPAPAYSTDDVLLVPQTGILSSRSEAKIDTVILYNSPMDTVASFDLFDSLLNTNQAAVSCRFNNNKDRMHELLTYKQYANYWFTVGANIKDFRMLKDYCDKHPDMSLNICVDVAHGDTLDLHKIYFMYSKQPWCKKLMSGTIATATSALNVFASGCTHIRVGIGPGSACSTRIVTGCGVPNLTAVNAVYEAFQSCHTPKASPVIIADGGIRSSGDVVKYLAAGADSVMVGNLLSKTEESPGWKLDVFRLFINLLTLGICYHNKLCYKQYRGQASAAFQRDKVPSSTAAPEGVQADRNYTRYSYSSFYNNLMKSIRSAISYLGLEKTSELSPENVTFTKITQNGLQESKPHVLK